MGLYYLERLMSLIKIKLLCLDGHIKVKEQNKCFVHKGAKITSKGSLDIGSCELMNNTVVSVVTPESRMSIGDNFYLNRNSIIACRNEIKIGNNVLMGPNVLIYDHDHNFDDNGRKMASSDDAYKVGTVTIEDNVWLAGGVIILRNSHIGKNAIIGAGCVIKGDIPANSIVKKNEELSICMLERREKS